MPCRKYKKRHKKDLTADEVDAIVEATKQPFRLQKDVAQQFRISIDLVSSLSRDAVKRPE